MIIKTKIGRPVLEYWLQYGNISDIVNKLLEQYDVSIAPSTNTYLHLITDPQFVNINVTYEPYLVERSYRGASSPLISLSRLLTHLCALDFANDWPQKQDVYDNVISRFEIALSSLQDLYKYTGSHLHHFVRKSTLAIREAKLQYVKEVNNGNNLYY